MNKTSVALIAAIASCGAFAKTIDLNGEWNFSKDGAPATAVRVPHDWSIGADFAEPKDEGSGMLPWKGEGRYSRTLTLSKEDAETLKSGGEAYIEFDGVMAQPAVVVNGVRGPDVRSAGGPRCRRMELCTSLQEDARDVSKDADGVFRVR